MSEMPDSDTNAAAEDLALRAIFTLANEVRAPRKPLTFVYEVMDAIDAGEIRHRQRKKLAVQWLTVAASAGALMLWPASMDVMQSSASIWLPSGAPDAFSSWADGSAAMVACGLGALALSMINMLRA
jgi:hypothetical protein